MRRKLMIFLKSPHCNCNFLHPYRLYVRRWWGSWLRPCVDLFPEEGPTLSVKWLPTAGDVPPLQTNPGCQTPTICPFERRSYDRCDDRLVDNLTVTTWKNLGEWHNDTFSDPSVDDPTGILNDLRHDWRSIHRGVDVWWVTDGVLGLLISLSWSFSSGKEDDQKGPGTWQFLIVTLSTPGRDVGFPPVSSYLILGSPYVTINRV